jgi:hypothetical protein
MFDFKEPESQLETFVWKPGPETRFLVPLMCVTRIGTNSFKFIFLN